MKVHQLFSESFFHDAMKARRLAAQRKIQETGIRLVAINKDGSDSKARDATKWFDSPAAAIDYHNNLVKLNPNKQVQHNLYLSNELGNYKLTLKGHYERKKT
jgi:hypothetical protein